MFHIHILLPQLDVNIYFQEITKNDEHQLTMARLDWELEQRKQSVL